MTQFLDITMSKYLLLEQAHPQWHDTLANALQTVDPDYLRQLQLNDQYLPGFKSLFAAFSRPMDSMRYILLGESPYPRAESANGYAFWDAAVGSLWSSTGLSKDVNRATSLRNLIKMLLFARGDLQGDDFSQAAIARLDKSGYVQTASDLFDALIRQGFLLLNASLVYSEGKIPYHARQWRPFMHCLLTQLAEYNPALQLVLFGKIAALVPEAGLFSGLVAEHPYNISFITNPEVVAFFKPMDLLGRKDDKKHC